MANANAEHTTTIGPDAFFRGHLELQKGAHLLGKFEGDITGKGELLIGQGAHIIADIVVDNIRVEGELKGNLHAAAKVELSSSGHVEGDIQTSRLEVAEGAILIGRCTVGPNGKDSSKGTSKIPTPIAGASGKSKGTQLAPEGSKK